MKSQIWLLDPRPNLPSIVNAVKKGFELSEATNTPVMLEVRIRACHVHGRFETSDNVRPSYTLRDAMENPRRQTDRIVLPPASYLHEKEKIEKRWPAAVKFIEDHKLNEFFDGDLSDIGIVMQGGMYNTTLRALELSGLADALGHSRVPLYVMNVTYPLIDRELIRFAEGKRAILIVEEGQPEFLEQAINTIFRRADVQTRIEGKGMLPMAGEYTGGVVRDGVKAFVRKYRPDAIADAPPSNEGAVRLAAALKGTEGHVHPRPPSFCTGCPERPIFTALKLVERELGPHHVSCDIGCHLFSILPPFNIGATTMGYGLGGAGAAAFNTKSDKRAISFVGDGGFWHNGLTSSIGNAVFNKSDNVTVIVDNGYTSATGGQDILSSYADNKIRKTHNSIEKAVRGVGVEWVRTLTHTYDVAGMRDTLREALTTKEKGPKVIVAQSECMLNKQRRERPLMNKAIKDGERVVRERFGVDPDTCTGDHSCIRLSGCPSLTVAPNPDPLRTEPVTKVINSCVGCGLCGEVAHAAVLCPSFYRASIVNNPSGWDRFKARVRGAVIGFLQRRIERRQFAAAEHERALPAAPAPDHHRDPRDGRRRRRRARRLDHRSRREQSLHRAAHLGARRRAAHRRDDLLSGNLSARGHHRCGARAGAGADAGAGRRRYRDRVRADGSRPRDPARADHAGPHHADRLDQPRVLDDREGRDGRRARRATRS